MFKVYLMHPLTLRCVTGVSSDFLSSFTWQVMVQHEGLWFLLAMCRLWLERQMLLMLCFPPGKRDYYPLCEWIPNSVPSLCTWPDSVFPVYICVLISGYPGPRCWPALPAPRADSSPVSLSCCSALWGGKWPSDRRHRAHSWRPQAGRFSGFTCHPRGGTSWSLRRFPFSAQVSTPLLFKSFRGSFPASVSVPPPTSVAELTPAQVLRGERWSEARLQLFSGPTGSTRVCLLSQLPAISFPRWM